jgi:hypothetical protein
MKTLKNLYTKVRKWAESGPRRQSTRQVRLGLEALERRELMSANPIAFSAWAPLTAGFVSSITTARDAKGNLDLFGIGSDHAAYYQSQPPGGAWSGWTQLGTNWVSSLSTALDASGNMNVFCIGKDNNVYCQSRSSSGAWSGWVGLTQGYVSSISPVLDAHGNLDLFAIGSDHNVYYQSRSGGRWSGWNGLTSGYVSSISTILDGSGKLDVFGIGSDQNVYYQSQSPSGAWSGWIGTPTYATSIWLPLTPITVSSISTIRDVHGNLDVFGIGSGGQVYYQTQSPGGSWSLWNGISGGANAISTSLDASGNLGLFVIGTDNAMYYQLQSPGGAWSDWMGLPGGVQALSPIEDKGGNLAIFAIGTDNNVYCREAETYSHAKGTLFNDNPSSASFGIPSYRDVQQGTLGDCWLLASLAEVAVQRPAIIQTMFSVASQTEQPDGSFANTYRVRFYDSSNQPQYVTVDDQLPTPSFDQPVGGGSGAFNGSSSPVLWVALAEKAYAEAIGAGIITNRGHVGFNDYDSLAGGDAATALQAIARYTASPPNNNPSDIASAWNAGQFVVLNTGSPPSSLIVGDHCYAMIGYNPSSSQPFQLFNPWGQDANGWAPGQDNKIYGQFQCGPNFLSKNFSTLSSGTSAVPGELIDQHARGLQYLADLDFLSALNNLRDTASKDGVNGTVNESHDPFLASW